MDPQPSPTLWERRKWERNKMRGNNKGHDNRSISERVLLLNNIYFCCNLL